MYVYVSSLSLHHLCLFVCLSVCLFVSVDDIRTMYFRIQPLDEHYSYISYPKASIYYSSYSCTSSALTSWRALTVVQPASKSTTETTRQRRYCIPSVETTFHATLQAVATQYSFNSCISSSTVLTRTKASKSTTQCSCQSKV